MAFPTYKSLLFSLKDNTFPDKVKLGSALRILWVLKLQTKLSSKSWIIQHLLPPYVIKSGIKVKLNCLFVPTVCKLCYIQMNLVRALCSLLLQIISLLTLPLMNLHSTCQGTRLVPWSPETLQFVFFYYQETWLLGPRVTIWNIMSGQLREGPQYLLFTIDPEKEDDPWQQSEYLTRVCVVVVWEVPGDSNCLRGDICWCSACAGPAGRKL